MDDELHAPAGMLTLEVAPSEDFVKQTDPRWREELRDLRTELARTVDGIPEERPGPGQKGFGLEAVLIELISAGAVSSLLAGFKAWLGKRPGRRSVTMKWEIDGRKGEVVVDAHNLESEEIQSLFREVSRRA